MADYAMFRQTTAFGIVILILYVDDMVIIGSDPVTISSLKQHLHSEFEMKDLGSLRYFLGIEVAYSPEGYLLSLIFLPVQLYMIQQCLQMHMSLHLWSSISSYAITMALHCQILLGIAN